MRYLREFFTAYGRWFILIAYFIAAVLLLTPILKPYKAHAAENICVAAGQWLNPATGPTTENDLIQQVSASPHIIMLGEKHTIQSHHDWHLASIKKLYAAKPDMVLAFEAFPRRVQPILDKWIAGDFGDDISAFLAAVDWPRIWGHPAELYTPVFHFAREKGIPMRALNVERRLIRTISARGWNGVPERYREGVSEPVMPPQKYISYLWMIFAGHGTGVPDINDPAVQRRFMYFAQAQTTWDRAFAEGLHQAHVDHPTATVVGIIGRGHLHYNWGASWQLKDLAGTGYTAHVWLPWRAGEGSCNMLKIQDTPAADYVYGIAS